MKLYILAFLLICLIYSYPSYIKHKKQIKMYKLAKRLSIQLNKPLLVIGDPAESSTNFIFGNYSCGDICIDMNGCKCNSNVINIKNKLEDELHKFKDNSVVIFESETLEYVDKDKIDYVIDELLRISNNNIFSVHELKPNSVLTSIKTNGYSFFNNILNKPIHKHKRLFLSCPLNNDYKYISN